MIHESLTIWLDELPRIPATAAAAIAGLVAAMLWVFGAKVARAMVALSGLIAGVALGWLAARAGWTDASLWVTVGVGAVAGLIFGVLLHRLWVGIVFAVVLGLSVGAGALTSQDQPLPPLAPMVQDQDRSERPGEPDPPAGRHENDSADRPDPSQPRGDGDEPADGQTTTDPADMLDRLLETIDRATGGLLGNGSDSTGGGTIDEAPSGDLNAAAADEGAGEAERIGRDVEQAVGEALKEPADDLADWWARQRELLGEWWSQRSGGAATSATIGALAGALGGLVLGLMLPTFATAVGLAMLSSAVLLVCVELLLLNLAPAIHERAGGLGVLMLVIFAVMVATSTGAQYAVAKRDKDR